MRIVLSTLFILAAYITAPAEARRVPICAYGSHPEGGMCLKDARDPYRCLWRFEKDNHDGTCSELSDQEFNRRQVDFENLDQDSQDRITKLDGDEDTERSIDRKNWEVQKQSLPCRDDPACVMPSFKRIGGYRNPWGPVDPACAGPGNGDC
jgi:hypothetical protein